MQQVQLPQGSFPYVPRALKNTPLFQRLFSSNVPNFALGVENAKLLFESMRHNFEASGSYTALMETLAQRQGNAFAIKKAIAFDIGPMVGKGQICTNDTLSHEKHLKMRRNDVLQSMLQLVFFACVVDHLSTNAEYIVAYAQDSEFTLEDEELFRRLNIQVIQFPQGEARIDETTFVKHRPRVYVGNSIDRILHSLKAFPALYDRALDDEGKSVMADRLRTFQQQHDTLRLCDPKSCMEENAHSNIQAYVAIAAVLGAEDKQYTDSCGRVMCIHQVTLI